MLLAERDIQEMLRGAGEKVLVDGATHYGIFRDAHVPLEFGELTVDSVSPQVRMSAADCAKMTDQSVLEVRGRRYARASHEPDGYGTATVRLRSVE